MHVPSKTTEYQNNMIGGTFIALGTVLTIG